MNGDVRLRMPKQKIRFGVGAPDGPRSAVWSLLWRDSDVYVVSVEAAGIVKFSYHSKIGELSWGYTRDHFNANASALAPRLSRDFERWQRPPQFKPGVTLPLRIYVANEALKTDLALPTRKPIRWVKPLPGRAVGFLFVLADDTVRENPYSSRSDLELLARARLPTANETLLLYAHQIAAEKISFVANDAIIDFTRRFPQITLPEHHRVYTQTNPSEPATGSRNFLEIPTYCLPVGTAG